MQMTVQELIAQLQQMPPEAIAELYEVNEETLGQEYMPVVSVYESVNEQGALTVHIYAQ
jgi:hypothetical protein